MRSLRGLAATSVFRWALAIATGFALMALLLFGFIYWQTAVHERERIDALVTRTAAEIAAVPLDQVAARLEAWLGEDLHGVRYGGLFGVDGGHLAGNLLTLPRDASVNGPAHRDEFDGIDRDHDGDVPEVVRAITIRLGGPGNLLVIGYDIDELEDVDNIILRALELGLLPALALSLVGGAALAWRAQRRIGSMNLAIGRIMKGQLSERLPVLGAGDDLGRLAQAVNGMLDEIERLVEDIRSVGDSIAHDLRTPLTRVRARLERSREEALSPDGFRAAIDRGIVGVDKALAVVSAVLRIGALEHSRRKAAFERIDLSQVLRDAVELYEPVAEERRVALVVDTSAAAPILGDHDLMLEAVGNLLDNAIKFAPVDSAVTLSLVVDTEAVRLRIADRGPGIASDQRERVMRRFYQVERSRTRDGTGIGEGSGLGLPLVAAVIGLHGFRIGIADAEPGCLVEITCPPVTEPRNPG